MLIKKLEDLFFQENKHLVEVLDKEKGAWVSSLVKQRGYGIVLIELKELNGLKFGIPLRSNIRHRECFKTTEDENKGLDYSKAVLLTKDSYIASEPFMIPPEEYIKVKDREHHITQMFTKYVEKYISGVMKGDQNVLRRYQFSTLQNYHAELGILRTEQ